MSPRAAVHVQTRGGFVVSWPGGRWAGRRRPLDLELLYLLLQADAPQSSESLGEQLWPGLGGRWTDSRQAQLRWALHRRLGRRVILRTSEGWTVDRRQVSCDRWATLPSRRARPRAQLQLLSDPPQLQAVDGRCWSPHRRDDRVLRLLLALAWAGPEGLDAHLLCQQVWGRPAAACLRQGVRRARGHLGVAAALLNHHGQYALNPEQLAVDLWQWEQQLQAGDPAARRQLPPPPPPGVPADRVLALLRAQAREQGQPQLQTLAERLELSCAADR